VNCLKRAVPCGNMPFHATLPHPYHRQNQHGLQEKFETGMTKRHKQFWLVKFAPFRTAWSEIVQRGTFTLRGVRSHQARNNLAAMRKGDAVFYYHSQQELQVVGVMQVVREAFPDPTSSDPKWLTVTFSPVKTLVTPVSLQTMRNVADLTKIALIRQPRLSVMPLTQCQFDKIITLSGGEDEGSIEEHENGMG